MSQEVWYRQVWPWVLISIPFSAVLFGIFMVAVALVYPDDLVDDNYYRDGMAINRTLDMDHNARRLGIAATLTALTPERIAFEVHGATDSVILFKLYHVTDSSRDTVVTLYPDEGATYVSEANVPTQLEARGIWYVELIGVDTNWRLRKRIVTPFERLEVSAQ